QYEPRTTGGVDPAQQLPALLRRHRRWIVENRLFGQQFAHRPQPGGGGPVVAHVHTLQRGSLDTAVLTLGRPRSRSRARGRRTSGGLRLALALLGLTAPLQLGLFPAGEVVAVALLTGPLLHGRLLTLVTAQVLAPALSQLGQVALGSRGLLQGPTHPGVTLTGGLFLGQAQVEFGLHVPIGRALLQLRRDLGFGLGALGQTGARLRTGLA